jgi:hypothetical protein
MKAEKVSETEIHSILPHLTAQEEFIKTDYNSSYLGHSVTSQQMDVASLSQNLMTHVSLNV